MPLFILDFHSVSRWQNLDADAPNRDVSAIKRSKTSADFTDQSSSTHRSINSSGCFDLIAIHRYIVDR
jgi:hypothetical protein